MRKRELIERVEILERDLANLYEWHANTGRRGNPKTPVRSSLRNIIKGSGVRVNPNIDSPPRDYPASYVGDVTKR